MPRPRMDAMKMVGTSTRQGGAGTSHTVQRLFDVRCSANEFYRDRALACKGLALNWGLETGLRKLIDMQVVFGQ